MRAEAAGTNTSPPAERLAVEPAAQARRQAEMSVLRLPSTQVISTMPSKSGSNWIHCARKVVPWSSWEVFEEMLGNTGFGEANMLESLARIARGMVMISATEQALSGSIAREQVPELLRISMDISQSARGGRSESDDVAARTAEFMKSLGVSVADPTDNRNLELPAREEREADYEVANHD